MYENLCEREKTMPITTIGPFELSFLQVLDEEGNLDERLDPDISDDLRLAMYRQMLRARMADDKLLKLQRQGRVGTFAPCTGQEAAVVGPALAMRQTDWFVGAFRELGGLLVRGVPVWKYYLYYAGYEEGNVWPEAPRTLPVSVPVASQLLHAVGLTYAARLQGEDQTAAVAFVGDGGTSQGDFHEALNMASVWNLPLVVVIQNNQWAISTPREAQARSRTLAQRALAYDIHGIQVDGNDVLATYKAVSEALARGRAGHGPTLVEAVTYRLVMHTTADDPKKYRDEEEVEKVWWPREPLRRFRRHLEKKGLWDDEREEQLLAEIREELARATERFETWVAQDRDPLVAFEHVYESMPPSLARQRAEFIARMEEEKSHA